MDDGTRTDICFDGMLTLSAGDGYHLYFEHGTVKWIEVYSRGRNAGRLIPLALWLITAEREI